MVGQLVFVYGSLMRGGVHHEILMPEVAAPGRQTAAAPFAPVEARTGQQFLGEAVTCEPWRLFQVDSYPALVPAPTPLVAGGVAGPDQEPFAAPIHGELFRVSDQRLLELDQFEDCPTLYQRVALDVWLTPDGSALTPGAASTRGEASSERALLQQTRLSAQGYSMSCQQIEALLRVGRAQALQRSRW